MEKEQTTFEPGDFLDLQCPFCATGVDFLVTLAGTAQSCPNCGNSLVVPRKPGGAATKIPPFVEGRSMRLRRIVPEDWKSIRGWWEGWQDVRIAEWITTQAAHRLTDEGQMIYLAIEPKPAEALLGSIGLQYTDVSHLQALFQIQINEKASTGLQFREACSLLFVFCFETLNLHRLFTQFPARYSKPCELLESLGMRREGHYRQDHLEQGDWQDTVFYALLRHEYEAKVGPSS